MLSRTSRFIALAVLILAPALLAQVPSASDPPKYALPPQHIIAVRSEEHTSELQSRLHLVCRLLLEKKKNHPSTPGQVQDNDVPEIGKLLELTVQDIADVS